MAAFEHEYLNYSLAPILHRAINHHQAGFFPGRFIAEHGLVLQLVLEQAQLSNHQGAGLLLDQEKSYDCAHPLYLEKTMLALGFPSRLSLNNVDCDRAILSLLCSSTWLWNLSSSIDQDDSLQGFSFSAEHFGPLYRPSPPLKFLAYADDVCIFLASPDDLTRIHQRMQVTLPFVFGTSLCVYPPLLLKPLQQAYTSVSNAHFNDHKTEAFALNSRPQYAWIDNLKDYNITTYHHHGSPTGFRYLGFPMCFVVFTTSKKDMKQG
ncbi:hypothetical protein [Absidia glauca]|uniref:Reverse transcriptase domain-containing protein n=1 Tax=Absidia glauca TaxID=4829 RepID=A0A163KDC9_ABSGL|nr:hypothetical protein [Absidia glauca]